MIAETTATALNVGINLLKITKKVKKMIDCFKTENYLAEKKRMTKITNTGVCKIKCANCPLSEKK